MKNRYNGTYWARLNACGLKQRDQDPYDRSKITTLVTNEETVRILMILMVMEGWAGQVLDVKGAFLHCEFEEGEEVLWECLRESSIYIPQTLCYCYCIPSMV